MSVEKLKSSARIAWIDVLKGFTIIVVILGHCLDGYLNAGMFPETQTVFHLFRELIYAFHMPLFFVISGYTFSLAYIKEQRLNCAKVAAQIGNLALTYTIWALLLWATKRVFAAFVNKPYDLRDLLNMFVIPLGNYWYIYVLTLIYVVVTALKLWRQKSALLLTGTALVLFAVRVFSAGIHPTIHRVFYYLFFFCVGIVFCRVPKQMQNKGLLILCAAISPAFWCLLNFCQVPSAVRMAMVPALSLSVSYLFVYAAATIRWKETGFLQLCGTYCLHIYLIHPYFTAGNRSILPMLGITQPYIALGVNTVSSLLLSLVIAVICGRISWSMILFRPIGFVQKFILKKQ